MIKIGKFLLEHKKALLAVFLLLIVQAYCDLALPSYTSNIVDVGIYRSGIESAVPDVLSKEQYRQLEGFIGDDKELFVENFKELHYEDLTEQQQKQMKKKYPGLRILDYYEFSGDDKVREELSVPISRAYLAISGLKKSNADIDQILAAPEESRKQMMAEMDKKMEGTSGDTISTLGATMVKASYEEIGMDIGEMQTNYLVMVGLKMIGISLIILLCTILVGYIAAKTAGQIGCDLRGRVFRKVVSFSGEEFDRFSTASLITRSTNDIQQIQMVCVILMRMIMYAPILGVGGIIKIFGTARSMSWIIAVGVAVVIAVVIALFVVAMPKFKAMQNLVDKLNLVTREILTGVPVIRAFSTEKHEEVRFDKANKDLTKTLLFTNRAMALMMPTMMLIINGISLMIVWFGAKGIDSGNLQVGEMMAFITYAMQIIFSFLMITMVSIILPRAGVSANRIQEVIDTEISINDPANPVSTKNSRTKGLLEFHNVSFHYPDAQGDTLENISFVAKPGQTTAFIGSTGSGKSTLVNLIPRFFDVSDGRITIDGVDVRDMSQMELRDKLGFVPQKAVLFSGTIESNIKYGKQDANIEEVKKAAAIAQSTDFIEAKEEKYESSIAQGGSNVSGGQKQRLSIARAVAKQPEIFVFDDSFSALDFKTDAAVRKALQEETNNSTVLVVAQRISTIMNADQIIVLDEGKIVGKGTHKELLKNCEVYYQIASSQLSPKEIEDTMKGGESHE